MDNIPGVTDLLLAIRGHEEELAVVGVAGMVITMVVLVGMAAMQPPLPRARMEELKTQ